MIGRLVTAEENYRDNLDYDLLPGWFDNEGYNSNGFAAGLLRSVGLDSSVFDDLVGGDHPVPTGCFTIEQSGCQ